MRPQADQESMCTGSGSPNHVFQLFPHLNIPIIGCGGIFDWQDAIEFFLAGASALQIGSALSTGYEIFENLINGVREYLQKHSYNHFEEIVGQAVENYQNLGVGQK